MSVPLARNRIRKTFEENWDEIFIYDSRSASSITFGEFLGFAISLAKRLEAEGVGKGDTVCIHIPNSLHHIILYFSLLKLQAVAVPLDPHRGKEDLREMIQQINPKCIICDENSRQVFSEYSLRVKTIENLAEDLSKASDIGDLQFFDYLDYDELFLITFTSGSTGAPKGVKHSFGNLITSAFAFGNVFGFGRGNVFYHNLPMSYMAGILNLTVLPFLFGCKIIIGKRFSVSSVLDFWDLPIKYGANTFWFIPTELALILKFDRGSEGKNYARTRKIIGCVGTAPLSGKLKSDFEKAYNISLYESYGLSETLFVSTSSPGSFEKISCVGKPLDGTQLSFMADGEIAIDVPWMFLGYTNADMTAYFHNKKYLSGDLGKIDANGLLYITGRKKELIKKGGLNISPRRLGDFIESQELFDEFAILGIEDEILGEKIVCFTVPKKESNEKKYAALLNNGISESLGTDYKIDEFVFLKELPRNISGKIDKPGLKRIYGVRK